MPTTEEFAFVRPSDTMLTLLCELVKTIRKHIQAKYPDVHVAHFVSEAGWRRGVAISYDDLPQTFVLLGNFENALDPEQDKFLMHSAMVFVGTSGDQQVGMKDLLPVGEKGDRLEPIIVNLNTSFQSLVNEATVASFGPTAGENP